LRTVVTFVSVVSLFGACDLWTPLLSDAAVRSGEAEALLDYLFSFDDIFTTWPLTRPLNQYDPDRRYTPFLYELDQDRPNPIDVYELTWTQTSFTIGVSATGHYGEIGGNLRIDVEIQPDAYSFGYNYTGFQTDPLFSSGVEPSKELRDLFGDYTVDGTMGLRRTGIDPDTMAHSATISGDLALNGGRIRQLQFDISYTATPNPNGDGSLLNPFLTINATGYLTSVFYDGSVLQRTY
jgi:hypothetical protein